MPQQWEIQQIVMPITFYLLKIFAGFAKRNIMKFHQRMEKNTAAWAFFGSTREKMWQFAENSQFKKSTIEKRMQIVVPDLFLCSFCLVILSLSWRCGRWKYLVEKRAKRYKAWRVVSDSGRKRKRAPSLNREGALDPASKPPPQNLYWRHKKRQ